MEDTPSSRPPEVDTPEGSTGGDDNQGQTPAAKGQTVKDRKCQYCQQSFTSSSLGRHLDQFLFKKKPDGIHNVEEIRRIRSGITRRQARTSTGKRDTPERITAKGQSDPYGAGENNGRSRDGQVRMMFNTPTWHATGVINDIPNPNNPQDGAARYTPSQSRTGSINLPDYARRNASSQNPDTMRALELALREVLDNIRAATYVLSFPIFLSNQDTYEYVYCSSRMRPRISPFDFDIQSQTFPSLCLQLLPPPPSLFSATPFPSSSSFSLEPPGTEHLEIVRQALRAKIAQWQSDQLSADATNNSQSGRFGMGMDSSMITRGVQQHEDMSLRHLELAYKHWMSLPPEEKGSVWQLEITRAFAREMDKRKSLDEQLARVQQEANQLRTQVERLGSCQWPREFALFPPDTLPLPRDVARELDVKESHLNPHSPRWDYENVVAKWKRVVMHDRSMGRVGVGYSNPVLDENDNSPEQSKLRTGDESNHSRSKSMQGARASSPENQQSPQPGGQSASSSNQYRSPYLESSRSPVAGGPPAKRARLMNGNGNGNGPEGSAAPSPNQSGPSASHSWNSHHQPQPLTVSNLAAPSAPTPSPSNSGA